MTFFTQSWSIDRVFGIGVVSGFEYLCYGLSALYWINLLTERWHALLTKNFTWSLIWQDHFRGGEYLVSILWRRGSHVSGIRSSFGQRVFAQISKRTYTDFTELIMKDRLIFGINYHIERKYPENLDVPRPFEWDCKDDECHRRTTNNLLPTPYARMSIT